MQSAIQNLKTIIPRNFFYCDVGARGGIEVPWKSFKKILNLISFEPDKEAYDLILKEAEVNHNIYPYALLDENKKLSINLTKKRSCSSSYKPNKKFLNKFPEIDRYEIEDTILTEAVSLDYLYNNKKISNIDFIKIDVQGASLDVLKGGNNCLYENILGIEVEVEFQPIYEKQSLFSDVDSYIRGNLGLQIQDLSKHYWKYPEGINVGATKGQLIWADALYFRAPWDIVDWCSNFSREYGFNKINMACLMGIVYGYLDYSLCLLNQPSINKYLNKKIIDQWKMFIEKHGKSIHYHGKGGGRLYEIFNIFGSMFQPSHNRWATSGKVLGSSKKYKVFM